MNRTEHESMDEMKLVTGSIICGLVGYITQRSHILQTALHLLRFSIYDLGPCNLVVFEV